MRDLVGGDDVPRCSVSFAEPGVGPGESTLVLTAGETPVARIGAMAAPRRRSRAREDLMVMLCARFKFNGGEDHRQRRSKSCILWDLY